MMDDVTFAKNEDEPIPHKKEYSGGAFYIDIYDCDEYLTEETKPEHKESTNKEKNKTKSKNKNKKI